VAVFAHACAQAFFGKLARAHRHDVCPTHTRSLHEPPDHDWIREHKLRRIVSKLKEKFPSPKAAMKKLDRDGGGDLDRSLVPRPMSVHTPGTP